MTDRPEVVSDPHFREEAELTWLAGAPGLDVVANLDRERLAAMVESPDRPLAQRLAAGAVLAVVGDPRIGARPRLTAITGGAVMIGTPPDQVDEITRTWRDVGVQREWIAKESPTFVTSVKDFWIGTYPVSNGEYYTFLTETGWANRPRHWYLGAYPWDRSNHPVCGLSAVDADAYVAWLGEKWRHPFRLPTEAEWEHAAKGPAGFEFPWGNTYDSSLANTRETGVHTTTPVGAFPAGSSPFGVMDMAGNVEEYVADNYYPYPGGQLVADHLTQTFGDYRICRGGSFARYADLARTRRRHGPFPGPLYPCGLRVATNIPGPPDHLLKEG